MPNSERGDLRNQLEFIAAWLLLKLLGLLPRRTAIFLSRVIGRIAYYLNGRLRRTAHRNLILAMPEMEAGERRKIVKGVFRNFGRLLGEFSQFRKINHENIKQLVVYEGYDHFKNAAAQGRGVLFLTGHIGAWELCAFAHGMLGHPLNFLIRPLDNPLVDRLIKTYRGLSGNRTIDKNNSVRSVLAALKRGEAVGLLIDANTLPDQGVFCDFFGIPACSTTGLAAFALRTSAPVVPGFLLWDERLKKHRLHFDPEVPLIRTGDFREDLVLNTAQYTKIIEQYARRYPDQWLWVHKRWHTRPEGEPGLYDTTAGPEAEVGRKLSEDSISSLS